MVCVYFLHVGAVLIVQENDAEYNCLPTQDEPQTNTTIASSSFTPRSVFAPYGIQVEAASVVFSEGGTFTLLFITFNAKL